MGIVKQFKQTAIFKSYMFTQVSNPRKSKMVHPFSVFRLPIPDSLLMDLARKMKLNLRVIRALSVQEPFTLREVNKVAVFVAGNIV